MYVALGNAGFADFLAADLRLEDAFLAGVVVVILPELQATNISLRAWLTGTLTAQQHRSMCTDTLAFANEAQSLGGCGLYSHPIRGYLEDFSDAPPHAIDEGTQFGSLKADGRIDVDHGPTVRANFGHRFPEQDFAVNPFVCRVRIRKMSADITHGPRSEQGIANDVKQHIGIAVAYRSEFSGDKNATQPQLFACGDLMDVVSVADPKVHHLSSRSEIRGVLVVSASDHIIECQAQ
jgi:hypothetical protein